MLDPTRHIGLTLIGFVGHVFSPAYARARARAARLPASASIVGGVDPEHHCALNVALDAPGRSRWVMTEWGSQARASGQVARDAHHLRLGATTFAWEGEELVVRLDARTAPFPAPAATPFGRPVVGEVRLRPTRRFPATPVHLTADGVHRWFPVAPVATATVHLSAPDLRFEGLAYHDANQGDGPLERDFRRWDWARMSDAAGTTVVYDTVPRVGAPRRFGRHFDAHVAPASPASSAAEGAEGAEVAEVDGVPGERAVDPAQVVDLPRAAWGVPRQTRVEPGATVEVVRTLLAAPFYNRSWLRVRSPVEAPGGAPAPPREVMHECFDGDRFAAPWVRFLLPFKMRLEGAPKRPALPGPGTETDHKPLTSLDDPR